MSNIIEFPKNLKDPFEQAIDHFKDIYISAGIPPAQIPIALAQLEPYIREILPPVDFTFDIASIPNLDDIQVKSIIEKHNESMDIAKFYYWDRLWVHLTAIADLIGENVQSKL